MGFVWSRLGFHFETWVCVLFTFVLLDFTFLSIREEKRQVENFQIFFFYIFGFSEVYRISWNAQYWSKRDGKRCYSCDKKTPTCEILDLFGIQSAKLCFRNKKTPCPFQSVIKSANLSWRFLNFKINRHRKLHVRFGGFSFPESPRVRNG